MKIRDTEPLVTVTLCVGSSCYVRGSDQVARRLQQMISDHGLQDAVDIIGTFCLEHCSMGVTLQVDGQLYPEILPQTVASFFEGEILPRVQVKSAAAGSRGGTA